MTDAVASPDAFSTHPLVAAADTGVSSLEAAWLEHLETDTPVETFLDALDVLPDPARRSCAGSLLGMLLDALKGAGRHADMLPVLVALGPHRSASQDMHGLALESLHTAFGNEEWYELFMRLADLDGIDVVEGLERFAQLVKLLPGSPVYHRTGWGEGVITALDLAEDGFEVTFTSEGRPRTMPFTTGLDVLDSLDRHDLRARLLVDLEGLKEEAQQTPSTLVRAVARLYKGKAGAKEIKERLAGTVIEESAWASWWRKAKAAAARDPFLSMENPSRPVFFVRKRPLSPEEEIRQSLSKISGLSELLEVVRGPLGLDAEEVVRNEMLDAVAAELDDPESGTHVERIEAALLLLKSERWEPARAGAIVDNVIKAGQALGPVLKSLKPPPLRREAWAAYREAQPKLWSDALIGELGELPPQVLDMVAEAMVKEGRGDALANRYRIFLMMPSRQVDSVLRLTKRFASGLFKDVENAPSVVEVVMGLLRLVETQAPLAARDDREARKAVEGAEALLFPAKPGLGSRFAKEATRKDMEHAMHVMARCRTMPGGIGAGMTVACNERFPDLAPRDDTPFWEEDFIYVSHEGLARREQEYRLLVEEKIPENSEAIGKAAAFGDLSENYEWTAAIEQQRQLTEKAAAMEAELRVARLIEDETLDEGVVQPGTRVVYERAGKAQTITILGPWDHAEGVVSYKAPVAAGMLGCKAGETATLDLPEGTVQVLIKHVEMALPA